MTRIEKESWRDLPMSWKQMQVLDQLGIHYDSDMTTRGEASDMITEGVETSEHPFSEDALQP